MKISLGLAAISLVVFGYSPAMAAEKAPKLQTDKQKVSYSIGHQIGSDFKMRGMDIDLDILMAGLRDGKAGKDSLVSREETMKLMQNLQKDMQTKMEADRAKAGKENLEKGKKFLEENKKKAGVVTLPSGLQYKILTKGTGPKPTAQDTVSTHYEGTLIDGTVFDSSYKRNEPAKFPVGGVIKGWTEALQLMPVGSKWELYVPSELAYGENGAGQQIGPNATLIFKVELKSIEPKGTAK